MLKIGGKPLRSPLGGIGEGPEKTRVLWLFVYLFCVVAASTVGRTAADTLFLSKFDVSHLSMMYLPQAASLILTGFLFQRYGSRARLDRLILALIPSVSLLAVLSRIGVGADASWIYPVVYVGYDVINFLMIVVFWQFASSVLDQRKAKRTIPLVGSGGLVGGIASGFGLKLLAPLVGTANLIFFYAGLQLLAMVAVIQVMRTVADRAESFGNTQASKTRSGKRTEEPEGGLFQSVPHLKYIAVLSAALVMSLTFVDYQFKVILRETLQNEALAGFMGSFYGFSGLCALVIQLFVAGKLVSRFGVMTSILVFPLALFAGSLGIAAMPVLAMALLAKGSDKVLGDTIYSSVNQLIMFPISPKWRNRAKSFLDGVVRNGAKGLAAISLIVLSPLLSAREFSFVVIALLGIGIYAAIRVKSAYLRMLLSSLETRGSDIQEADLDLMDPASRELLVGALQSGDRQQALYALRILSGLGALELQAHLPALIRHPADEVAVEALRHAERTTPEGLDVQLLLLLDDADIAESVKAQALIALAAYGIEGYLEPLAERLEAEGVALRAGAIAGLIKYYGIEGMFRAVGTLKALLESGRDDERTAMASLFGRIGIPAFYKPLIPLLQDRSSEVRRNALQSAGKLLVPELVPHVVPLLQESQTRREAIEALASYDDKVVLPLLAPYLDGRHAASPHVPKAFERIGTQIAFQMLLSRYEEVHFDMRDKLIEAMTGMDKGTLQINAKAVERLALGELASYSAFAERLRWAPLSDGDTEVREAAEHVREAMMRRVFRLLSLIHDTHTIDAVYAGWAEGDARRQANAAEVMDQLLRDELRTELTRWMLVPGRVAADQTAVLREEQLIWLYDHGDESLREAIRYAVLEGGATGADEGTRSWLRSPSAADEEALRERMKRLRLLRSCALFEGMTGKDLLPIVRCLREVEVAEGQYVFREKDPGDSLYLLREGMVGVYRGDMRIDGREDEGSFGQTSVLTGRPRTAAIRAESHLRLLRLDSADFYEAMFDRTELALEMMKRLSRMLRSAMAAQATASPEAGAARDAAGPVEAGDAAQQAATAREAEPGGSGDIRSGAKRRSETQAGNKNESRNETEQKNESRNETEQKNESRNETEHIHNRTILRRVLVLQKIELFSQLSQDDFVRLAHRVEEVVYEPGEAICQIGEHGDAMFGIIEGRIRVHRGPDTVAMLGVGQCFGEMAIIDSGPRSADCTAAERAVLLKLGRQQVISFCFQQLDALKGMMKVLADRLRDIA